MIFRPKIFISSTFSDNMNLRQKIREYFYSVGAEPLLYENELTPSTIPMTYRENIKDADFVILIMRNNYGTKTDWNISGTHEEYIIARNNSIPIHVYLLKNTAEAVPADNPLIGALKADQVSYYYYKNDKDLLSKLKETTFTIAKEIMLNQIVKNNLPSTSIAKLSGNLDYNRAIEVIQIIESMKICKTKYGLDWLDSNLFMTCLEPIQMEFSASPHNFLNWKLDELLNDMLSAAQSIISNYVLDYTRAAEESRNFSIAVLGKVAVSESLYHPNTKMSQADYVQEYENFFKKYEAFKLCVQEIRTTTDLA